MAYTLITSLGTGMFKEGYRKTKYLFNNGKSFETAWFMQALLECKYRDFEKIILVGTTTSNWDALIDLNDEDAEKLWENLSEKNSSKIGITEDLIEPLQKQLEKQYKISVKILVHTDKIDSNTTEDVFECYQKVIPEVPKKSDILFDITHGFRSMPILMYQTLQFIYSQSIHNIEFVYGDYKKDDNIGYVRDLSKFWDLAQITDAIQLFESKLDGFRLSELIKKDWERGSKAIKSLSDIAQTNFALQFMDVSKQIKNALKFYPENAPSWLSKIKKSLEAIDKLVIDNNVPRTLLNYAKYLYDRNLNTQAIITLQITVESSVAIKNGRTVDELGDYDWWQNYGKNHLQNSKNQNWNDLKDLKTLERIRNQIAHGGGKDKLNGKPSASNLPNIFKKSFSCVERLLEILGF